ncbi:DMT family transporter [Belnapia rosea]|uniref:DMT family transporter n=1 Tax=Belnapia rosea TaxID=938405 RepID=UPI000880E0CA|nr:DMT family transporter [Belnapia rosea]SDB68848.1 EamA-like transporter family protein [Belnapia rosea]
MSGRGAPATGQLAGFGYLTVTATAWGLNWPIMKLLMLDWPPFTFRVLAASGSVLLLSAIALLQRDALLPRADQWGRLVVAALLNVTSWLFFAPVAIFWLDASEAAIIAYTMPVWATILAWPFLGERPGWRRLMGLALGLSGVTLLMAGRLDLGAGLMAGKLPGVLAILATALLFACGTIWTKRFPLAMAPVPLVAWQLAIGVLPVAAVALAFEQAHPARVGPLGWACLAYASVIGQCLAYLAWFRALKRLPAGTAAIGSLLVPVVGVLGSAALLGEPFGLRQVGALALTLGGVALASRG